MTSISVIIPTYKRPHLLKDAITSVLNQTYRDFELIVVDDGSNDDTASVVEGFQDQRIIYLKHDRNRGTSAAKNTGINIASGEYLISLDDDDLMSSRALDELVRQFERSSQKNLGGVYGWSWWVYRKGKTLKVLTRHEKGNIFDAVLKDQVFTNILVKRKVFDIVGLYDETLVSNEDYDFYLRLARSYTIDFIPRILFVIRFQAGTHLSRISRAHLKSHKAVMQKYSSQTKGHTGLLAPFVPMRLYVKLSRLKHRLLAFFRTSRNYELKKEIKELQEALKIGGIYI